MSSSPRIPTAELTGIYGAVVKRMSRKMFGAVRQIAHRAREHVAARRPRMQVDRAQQEVTLEKFMAAISSGDMQGLMEVLAPDVVLIADGGGLVAAARKPITGVDRVAPYLVRLAELPDVVTTAAWFNGMPGARVDVYGEATAVSVAVEDGRITRIYAMRNPEKMRWLERSQNYGGDRPGWGRGCAAVLLGGDELLIGEDDRTTHQFGAIDGLKLANGVGASV